MVLSRFTIKVGWVVSVKMENVVHGGAKTQDISSSILKFIERMGFFKIFDTSLLKFLTRDYGLHLHTYCSEVSVINSIYVGCKSDTVATV